jgi:2-C-methyl-D-erythritol 4-phosphate cytidylyltransferase/2-C-methyl-D-erythritol 4-phosphate cytidylyltransferase/2-C-methyl-D-erythritol 2,4-cyclodiphosphate synthase
MNNTSIVAIIPAGGIGKRMKTQKPKQFLTIDGEPVIVKTAKALAKCKSIKQFIIPTVDVVYTRKIFQSYAPELNILIISSGKTRQESVANGLEEIRKFSDKPDLILVHDSVRALVQEKTINEVVEKAIEVGGAIAAAPASDTLKLANAVGEKKNHIKKNIPRDNIWEAKTPQVYKTELIIEAYDQAKKDHFLGTDSAGLIERLGKDVILVQSPKSNIKITTPEDLEFAELFLKAYPVGA